MKKKKIVSVVAFMLCTAMLAGTITACTSQSADTTQNTTDDTTQGGVTQMETTYDTENSGGNISELIDTTKREYYPISVLENFRVQTAEITATALMNYVGLETKGSFRNSTAYIQSWLTALRNDKRMIVSASGAASKAFHFIVSAT